MDSSGVSILGVKPLPSEVVVNVYTNPALNLEEGARKGSASNIATISTNATFNKNGSNSNSSSNTPTVTMKTGADNTYNELPPPPKRDSSTVDFTLPSKVPSRERLKSISEGPYRGMGKEELLRFSSRPLWRNLRYVCMSIVLTGWLALLITVVALVLTYPECREAQRRDWWQKTVIYRVFVRSFHDSNTDGIGDINGIRQKLDYIHELGVNTISLSPIYKLSTNALTDTHVVNHKDIDSVFGTMEQFKLLVNETHQRGMHITLDFIPNHTSDEHPWFVSSKANNDPRQNLYRSYYVWTKGRGTNGLQAPNNWKSVFECSAWHMSSDNTFYLHQFLPSQPELNLRSQKVRDALEEVLQFWLDLGVDGFYIRDSDYLFEDYDLRDDTLVDNTTSAFECTPPVDRYDAYDHMHTKGLPEIFDMFARWRAFLDDYGNKTNHYRMLFADVDGTYEHVMNYYGLFNRDGVDFPLNKFSLDLNTTSGGLGIAKMVSDWMKNMPHGRWPNWMGGDDRSARLADRLGDQMARPYLILAMLLPGTPFLYYGDEIGLRATAPLPNGTHGWERTKPMRGPMQWNNRTNSGFCPQYCAHPWMAINPEYKNQMNAEAQMRDPDSIWNLVKNLTALRKDKPAFEYGDYIPAVQDEDIFSFVREFDGETGYLVALNFADKESKKKYTGLHETIPGSAKVEIVSGKDGRHSMGSSVGLDPLTLNPFEGIVVSWDYQAKEL